MSCNTHDSNIEKKANRFNQLHVPEKLEIFTPNPDSLVFDSTQLAQHSNYKIYAFIDVSCPSCIADIDLWNNVYKEFIIYNVPIILICYSKGNFEYFKYLFESKILKNFPFPIYLDIDHQLYQQNSYLDESESHHAIITDRYNNILIEGNPLFSMKVKSEYLKLITP